MKLNTLIPLIFAFFAFLLTGHCSPPSASGGADSTITVTGEATEEVANDIASVQLSVRRTGKTQAEADSSAGKALATLVLWAQQAKGVHQATPVPQLMHQRNTAPDQPSASVGIVNCVVEAQQVASFLTHAGTSGATQLGIPQFRREVTENDVEKTKLLKAAFQSAKQKAQVLADAVGGSVGKVVSITEESPATSPYSANPGMAAFYRPSMPGGVPSEASKTTIESKVQATFLLEQKRQP